jgi:HSP20 family protein
MVFRNQHVMNQVVQLRDEVDRLLTNALNSSPVVGARRFVTGLSFQALNVWEDEGHVYVEAELPGVKADDLDVSVVDDELTLKGKRSEDAPEKAAFHRRERGLGEFTRMLRLPSPVNADQVQASLDNGVLLLTLPKAESAKPRKIKVNATK